MPATSGAVLRRADEAQTATHWKDRIGFNSLSNRLGAEMLTGSTIGFSQVEMAVGRNSYLPDPEHFSGWNINRLSGRGGISSHATTVAQHYFGIAIRDARQTTNGAADGTRSGPTTWRHPGKAALLMDAYEANDWSGLGFLNLNTRHEPRAEQRLIQNHSWVGTFGIDDADMDALRRIDLLVHRDGVLVTAGVKNGMATPMPRLMSSAYNVLAVGLTSGDSSFGPTSIEGSGRVKPDIVAPLAATSWATPVVAACGALLLATIEQGGHLDFLPPDQRRQARPLLSKALLMGGATKEECRGWRRGLITPSTGWAVPLDARYGAGQLNIDNSHRILTAGRSTGGLSSAAPLTGWDYAQINGGESKWYLLNIPATRNGATASILVTWHRKIVLTGGIPLGLNASLADINLRLYRVDETDNARVTLTSGGTMIAPPSAAAPGVLVDASLSAIDNVEHIYRQRLQGGRYLIQVTSDRTWEYCLTWDVQAARDDDWQETLYLVDGAGRGEQPPETESHLREPASRRMGALATTGDASAGDWQPAEDPAEGAASTPSIAAGPGLRAGSSIQNVAHDRSFP